MSVSRGREAVNIYTDDKDILLEHASDLGERQSALELVSRKNSHIKYMQLHQRNDYETFEKHQKEKTELRLDKQTIDKDYEPGF